MTPRRWNTFPNCWHRQELEVRIVNEDKSLSDYKILLYTETYPRYNLFDFLEVKGKLSEIENNSDFDYISYLNNKGVFALCFYPYISRVDNYNSNNIFFLFWNLKKKVFLKINKNLPEPVNGLVKAMILGSKSQLLPELKERLERQGLAHVLTVSGLHIGLLVYFLQYVLKKLKFKKKTINFVLILFILFYLTLISFPISALRSSLMIVFVFFSNKGIKKRFFNVLFLVLIVSPKLLFNVSFQLSFLAVFAIIFFLPIVSNFLFKFFDFFNKGKLYFKSKIISLFNLSLAINIVLWPLVVYYFSYYNYLSPLYNLLIIPVVPFFLILSFLAIIFPVFYVAIFYLVYNIGLYINLISFLDFGYFELDIELKFLIIYYLIILIIVLRNSVFFKRREVLRFIYKAKKSVDIICLF